MNNTDICCFVGKGSLRQRADGRYEYIVRYKDQVGELKRKSFYGKREYECYEKADVFLEKLKSYEGLVDVTSTIPDIVKQRYKSDLAKNFVGEQGYGRNMSNLRIIEKSFLGKIPIVDVTELQIETFLGSITHYSTSVISKIFQQLRMAFNIAFAKNVVRMNLMTSQDIRCPKSDKKNKKIRGMTEEEQRIFVHALRLHSVPEGRNNYKLQLLIELYSGMRMGEINALIKANIDLKRGIVHVRRTVSRDMDYQDFIKDGTKTYAGIRDIPINKQLKEVLTEAIKNQKNNKEGLLFYDYYKDAIISTSQVNCFFRRMCDKAGIEYNGQHALRHTFATRCIEAGVPAIVLKSWLGHTNIHITLDTYADVFDRMNFDAMDKFDAYVEKLDEESGGSGYSSDIVSDE